MPVVARRSEHQKVARPLKVLIPLIEVDLVAGDSAGSEHYRDAGEKLLEARAQVPFHGWGRWLKKNFELSRSTAYAYMQLAQHPPKVNGRPLTLREARGQPRSSSDEPGERRWKKIRAAARAILVDDYGQEEQQHSEERRLYRELALKLIDLGFRALATRLHPDRGGSAEAMTRLNQVRDKFTKIAKKQEWI